MSLRSMVRKISGQDVYICRGCNDCDISDSEDMDIPISGLVRLTLLNDDEALRCRTLWSDSVLEASRGLCKRGLDLYAVMTALRGEAGRREEQLTTENG